MNIHDLKIGDKLRVLLKVINRNGESCFGDILEIIEIAPDINNTLWISHENNSFSGGGFRIKNKGSGYSGYELGVDVELYHKIKNKKENYKYLIKLFKKLNIQ